MGGGLKGKSWFCRGQDRAGISTLKNKHADASFCAVVADRQGGAKEGGRRGSGNKIK